MSAPGLPPQRVVASFSAVPAARLPGLPWAALGAECSPSVWKLERKAEVSGENCRKAQTTHKHSAAHRGAFKTATGFGLRKHIWVRMRLGGWASTELNALHQGEIATL